MFSVVTTIGSGAQHTVGRLEDSLLIKYPHWKGRRWDSSTSETVSRDLAIHRAFGIPIPETRVISRPVIDNGKAIIKAPYAIITEEIRGRVFREADLTDDEIYQQVTKLTEDSLAIGEKYGAGIDFLGGAAIGNFLHYLTREKRPLQLGAYNIIIDSRNRIKLIDTNLLDPARAPWLLDRLVQGLIDLQNGLMAGILRNPEMERQYLAGNPNPVVEKVANSLVRYSREIEKKRQTAAQPADQKHKNRIPA